MRAARPAVGLLLAGLLAACGGNPGAPQPVAARPYDDPGFARAGDFEMRYGIVRASELNPAIAKAYGIVRSDNRAVLTVAVLRQMENAVPLPVAADIRGHRRRLTGETTALEFRSILEGRSVSYVAEFDIGTPGPVLLEFEAVPAASGPTLAAKVVREFGSE